MILLTEFQKAVKGEPHLGKHLFFDFRQFGSYIKAIAAQQIEGSKARAKALTAQFAACQCQDKSRRLNSKPISTLLVIDFDCQPGNLIDMTRAFSRYDGRRLLYTTPSHEAAVPRFRICIPLSRTIGCKVEWKRMASFFIEHYFQEELPAIDKMASCSIVHLWKAPCNSALVLAVDGTPYEPYIPPAPPVPPALDLKDMLTYPEGKTRAERYVIATIENVQQQLQSAPDGHRNHAINSAGHGLGKLIPSGLLTEQEVISIIVQSATFIQIAEEDGLTQAKATMRSGIEAGKRKGHSLDN